MEGERERGDGKWSDRAATYYRTQRVSLPAQAYLCNEHDDRVKHEVEPHDPILASASLWWLNKISTKRVKLTEKRGVGPKVTIN